SKAASFFDVDSVSPQGVEQVFDYTTQQSGQGGSECEPVQVKSPTGFPNAMYSVLFRPMPCQASIAHALIAEADCSRLLVLCAEALPQLVRLPKYLFRVPYVAYALTYTVMFVIAFSSISNFGILTRQRTQVLPLLLVLLVLPRDIGRAEPSRPPTLEERT